MDPNSDHHHAASEQQLDEIQNYLVDFHKNLAANVGDDDDAGHQDDDDVIGSVVTSDDGLVVHLTSIQSGDRVNTPDLPNPGDDSDIGAHELFEDATIVHSDENLGDNDDTNEAVDVDTGINEPQKIFVLTTADNLISSNLVEKLPAGIRLITESGEIIDPDTLQHLSSLQGLQDRLHGTDVHTTLLNSSSPSILSPSITNSSNTSSTHLSDSVSSLEPVMGLFNMADSEHTRLGMVTVSSAKEIIPNLTIQHSNALTFPMQTDPKLTQLAIRSPHPQKVVPTALISSTGAILQTEPSLNELQTITISESQLRNASIVNLKNSNLSNSESQLVTLQASDGGVGEQIQIITPGISGAETLQLAGGNSTQMQTVTIVPSAEMTQGGEASYLLIVSQGDGDKQIINKAIPIDSSMIQGGSVIENDTVMSHEVIMIQGRNVIQVEKVASNVTIPALSCNMCDYTTNKKYLLSRHIKGHTADRPHRCTHCDRTFKTASSLTNHANTHTGTRPNKCKFCESAFTTSGELVRHIRYKHTFEKPHKCPECEYCSVELSKLKRHIRSHTGERPYQCEHCSYASPDTYKLKRHMRIHTGEKPYPCDLCGVRFTQSNSLKAHKLIHSGTKPAFQCQFCPTTCGRKTDLKIHMQKMHNTNQDLECKKCQAIFTDRYTYKVHVRTHEGEKCYKCEHCEYSAISHRHLSSHMLTHTGIKPFNCDICEQSFRQKQLLKRHVNLHHTPGYTAPAPKDKFFECAECERCFAHKGNWLRHLSMHDTDALESPSKLVQCLNFTTQHLLDLQAGTGKPPQIIVVHPDGHIEEITPRAAQDAMRLASADSEDCDTRKDDETESGEKRILENEVAETGDSQGEIIPEEVENDPDYSAEAVEDNTELHETREAGTQAEMESDSSDSETMNCDANTISSDAAPIITSTAAATTGTITLNTVQTSTGAEGITAMSFLEINPSTGQYQRRTITSLAQHHNRFIRHTISDSETSEEPALKKYKTVSELSE